MKLTVDLSNADDVSAALSLLRRLARDEPADVDLPPPTGLDELPTPAAIFGAAAPAVPLAPTMPSIAAATPGIVAPPVPTSTAPVTPTSGPASLAAPAPSEDLDSAGVPWSAELHAANKAKCKDGTWKAKRGLTGAAAPAVPLAPTTPIPPAPIATAPASVPPPTAPTPPAAAPAAASVPSSDPTTFAQLMPRVTAAVTNGILPAAEMRAACEECGLSSVVTLQEKPECVPMVWAWLVAKYPAIAGAQ